MQDLSATIKKAIDHGITNPKKLTKSYIRRYQIAGGTLATLLDADISIVLELKDLFGKGMCCERLAYYLQREYDITCSTEEMVNLLASSNCCEKTAIIKDNKGYFKREIESIYSNPLLLDAIRKNVSKCIPFDSALPSLKTHGTRYLPFALHAVYKHESSRHADSTEVIRNRINQNRLIRARVQKQKQENKVILDYTDTRFLNNHPEIITYLKECGSSLVRDTQIKASLFAKYGHKFALETIRYYRTGRKSIIDGGNANLAV